MSRRTFYRGTLEICSGFDVLLQHFVLDIYDHAPLNTGQEDRIVYSSLDESPDTYAQFSLTDVQARLQTAGIRPQAQFFQDLRADAQSNASHVDVIYDEMTEDDRQGERG